MIIYHDTCTYCVHNVNPDRLGATKCENKGCDWQKSQFESVSDEEIAEIDRKYAEEEKNRRDWEMAEKIATGYIVILVGLMIVTAILGISFRFSHPELTETQLFLELWKHYWGLYLIMIGLVVFPRLLKR